MYPAQNFERKKDNSDRESVADVISLRQYYINRLVTSSDIAVDEMKSGDERRQARMLAIANGHDTLLSGTVNSTKPIERSDKEVEELSTVSEMAGGDPAKLAKERIYALHAGLQAENIRNDEKAVAPLVGGNVVSIDSARQADKQSVAPHPIFESRSTEEQNATNDRADVARNKLDQLYGKAA